MADYIEFLPPCISRTNKVTSALSHAVFEWLLIALLLFNSLLSYFTVKFASFFGLQLPCLWCSRVDHVLEPKRMHNLYRLLVCDSHAREISSLSYCSTHRKLCISQSLCRNCSSDHVFSLVDEHMTCSCCASPFENKSVIASGTDRIIERSVDSVFHQSSCVPESELGFEKEEEHVLETRGFGGDDGGHGRTRKDVKFHARNDDLHHLTTPIVAAEEANEKILAKDEHEHQDDMIFVEMRDGDKEVEFVIGTCSSSDADEGLESNSAAIDLLELDLLEKQDLPISDSMVNDEHEQEVDLKTHIGCVVQALESCKNGESDDNCGNERVATMEQLKAALLVEKGALNALYEELGEERNASAVAANQTMAMINRLQGEKAAMQMEALQYQRIMEEQSEYDLEALQLLNDLLVKKEKERNEMEKELDLCRKKVSEYEFRERMSSSLHENEGEDDDAVLNVKESLAEYEDERLSIVEQLRILEGKLLDLNEEEEEEESGICETDGGFDDLNERLKALEGDMEFLAQCVGSLKKGEKGVGVLQQILHHLRHLKKVELRSARMLQQKVI